MIPTKPTAADNVQPPPQCAADVEPGKKRIPLISIPATISIGLLIAAIYLGGRIVTAHRVAPPAAHAASTIAQASQAQPVPPPPAAETPVAVAEVQQEVNSPLPASPDGDSDLEGSIPLITPKAGERYIQVGALDPQATRRFIRRLRSEKLEPHVAPGPKPELMRVLIGPIDDHDQVNQKQADLQAEGIASFIRKY